MREKGGEKGGDDINSKVDSWMTKTWNWESKVKNLNKKETIYKSLISELAFHHKWQN